VHLGEQLLAQAHTAMERAVMDGEAACRSLRVEDREEDVALEVAQDAAVPDLTAAFRVEGRAVEDKLGLRRGVGAQLDVADRFQLLVLRAVAQDGDHPSWRARRLVAQEVDRADATRDGAV